MDNEDQLANSLDEARIIDQDFDELDVNDYFNRYTREEILSG